MIHLNAHGHPACGARGDDPDVAACLAEVTCERCKLAALGGASELARDMSRAINRRLKRR